MKELFFSATEILGGILFATVLIFGAIQLFWDPRKENDHIEQNY